MFISVLEKKRLEDLSSMIDHAAVFGVPEDFRPRSAKPLWEDAKYAYIWVDDNHVMAKVSPDRKVAFVLDIDVYETSGSTYENFKFDRWCRLMDM